MGACIFLKIKYGYPLLFSQIYVSSPDSLCRCFDLNTCVSLSMIHVSVALAVFLIMFVVMRVQIFCVNVIASPVLSG